MAKESTLKSHLMPDLNIMTINVIMLALVDAQYCFLYVDVGSKGRASDSGVWDKCTLRQGIEDKILSIPPATSLPFVTNKSPFVIVGDDAFPLKTYLMKPYPGRNMTEELRIFNYRLSRARRVSENAFGILVSKFRIFEKPIAARPETVKKVIFTTVEFSKNKKWKTSTASYVKKRRFKYWSIAFWGLGKCTCQYPRKLTICPKRSCSRGKSCTRNLEKVFHDPR